MKTEQKWRKARNFAITINNPEYGDLEKVIDNNYRYIIMSLEYGEEKHTPHYQGFISLKNPISIKHSNTRKHFGERAHVEVARCNELINKWYCSKERDIVYEDGDIPQQGKRTDLNELKDEILAGKTDAVKIRSEKPMLYHQYGRTIDKLEDDANRNKYRTWMTEGTWYHGPTGCGKSTIAMEGYHPETHYIHTFDKDWWDHYKGQETVIIDDYRGELTYGHLLKLMDRHPMFVSQRGRAPQPFLAKNIIITSSMPPELVYKHLSKRDSLDQLYRRCKIVDMGSGTEVLRK